MTTLYIEGASTAEGQGGGPDFSRSWASHVRMAYPNDYVVNRAQAGLSLSAINRRWQTAQQEGKLFGEVRILSVGQNEARISPDLKKPTISLQRFAGDLAVFSRATREAGMLSVYIGPQPVDESKTNPTPFGWYIENDLTEEYAAVVKEQAAKDNTSYIDVAELFSTRPIPEVMDDDGRHPNSRGHLLIARSVVRELTVLGVEASLPTL